MYTSKHNYNRIYIHIILNTIPILVGYHVSRVSVMLCPHTNQMQKHIKCQMSGIIRLFIRHMYHSHPSLHSFLYAQWCHARALPNTRAILLCIGRYLQAIRAGEAEAEVEVMIGSSYNSVFQAGSKYFDGEATNNLMWATILPFSASPLTPHHHHKQSDVVRTADEECGGISGHVESMPFSPRPLWLVLVPIFLSSPPAPAEPASPNTVQFTMIKAVKPSASFFFFFCACMPSIPYIIFQP